MRCLINYARTHVGAGGVASSRALERAAGEKSGDVMRCGFSHTACGKPADLYPRRYRLHEAGGWQWGENLAFGRGKRGTARKILKAWLNSPPHRETMLRGSFDDAGDRAAQRRLQRPPKRRRLGAGARLSRVLDEAEFCERSVSELQIG